MSWPPPLSLSSSIAIDTAVPRLHKNSNRCQEEVSCPLLSLSQSRSHLQSAPTSSEQAQIPGLGQEEGSSVSSSQSGLIGNVVLATSQQFTTGNRIELKCEETETLGVSSKVEVDHTVSGFEAALSWYSSFNGVRERGGTADSNCEYGIVAGEVGDSKFQHGAEVDEIEVDEGSSIRETVREEVFTSYEELIENQTARQRCELGTNVAGNPVGFRGTEERCIVWPSGDSIESFEHNWQRPQNGDQNLQGLVHNPIDNISVELGPKLKPVSEGGKETSKQIQRAHGTTEESQLAEGKRTFHRFFQEELKGVTCAACERVEIEKRSPTKRTKLETNSGKDSECNTAGIAVNNRNEELGKDGFEPSRRRSKEKQICEPEDRAQLESRRGQLQGGQESLGATHTNLDKSQAPAVANFGSTGFPGTSEADKQTSGGEAALEETYGKDEVVSGVHAILKNIDGGSSRSERPQQRLDATDETGSTIRLDGGRISSSVRGEDMDVTEIKPVRAARPSGGKDRHSKVHTAKGPRDRRVRLSVQTAIQFYDVQDRLGFDQPSKAVEWLIKKAKHAIDELARVPTRAGEGPQSTYDVTYSSGVAFSEPSASTGVAYSGTISGHFGDGNNMGFYLGPTLTSGLSYGNATSNLQFKEFGAVSQVQEHMPTTALSTVQSDLFRGNIGNVGIGEGYRVNDFGMYPSTRVESRTKARERARERAKEKSSGREGSGAVRSSSPCTFQSTHMHHAPFNVQESLQNSVQSSSLQSSQRSPGGSSTTPNLYMSLRMHTNDQGGLQQNFTVHNCSARNSRFDVVPSSLHGSGQPSLQNRTHPQLTVAPHSRLDLSTMQVNTQGGMNLSNSSLNSNPAGPSSFSDSSISSSLYASIASFSPSQSLQIVMPSSSSLGPHYPVGSPTPIPPGFSPGPPAPTFRPHTVPVSQEQQHGQRSSKPSRLLSSYSSSPDAHASLSPQSSSPVLPAASSSPKGAIQPGSTSVPLRSTSFPVMRSAQGYEYHRATQQLMSPGRNCSPYQSLGCQIPARIQGLDALEEDAQGKSPSSSSVT